MRRTLLLHACLFLTCIGRFVECGNTESLNVLTFNAALLQSSIADDNDLAIPINREDRRDALTQYLNEQTNADIVCLQEVPFGQDVEKIVNGVNTTFPYAFSELHLPDGTLPPQSTTMFGPACDVAAFAQLSLCIFNNNCLTGNETATVSLASYTCIFGFCGVEFSTLLGISGEECLSCIITNSPANYYRCGGPAIPDYWNMNKLGLLLLSKKPLSDTSAVEFYPYTLDTFTRGYLQVKAGDYGLNVACVHVTTSTIPFPPLNPQFASFAEQNAAEVQLLIDTFSTVEPLLMIGDYNTGPAAPPSINPVLEPTYDNLDAAFRTKLVNEPTFSATNPYNTGTSIPDSAIDHVFSDRHVRTYKVKVVLKEDDVSVTGGLPLSDHYGVEAFIKICLKRGG